MTKKSIDRGDGRDAKGRWTKGTCGNPNGRPPKVADLDMADVYNFSHYPMEIVIGGEKQLMTRHEIVLFKTFESALKGRITAQKFLINKFEEADMSREYLELWLERMSEQMAEDPRSVPKEDVHLMAKVLEARNRPRSKIRTRQAKKRRRN